MATKQILTQFPSEVNLQTHVRKSLTHQLLQLHRHDPAAAAAAERLLAAGFPEAARHRIRQAMHQLLDQHVAARKAASEVQS